MILKPMPRKNILHPRPVYRPISMFLQTMIEIIVNIGEVGVE